MNIGAHKLMWMRGAGILSVILLIIVFAVGWSYFTARNVADAAMAKTSDGPWVYARGGLIVEIDGDIAWVFRYRQIQTGQYSIRVFVGVPRFNLYHTGIGLDEHPALGRLP